MRRPAAPGSASRTETPGVVPVAAAPARRHWALATLAAANAAAAWVGMFGLVGGWLSLGTVVTDRLPFNSPDVAGLALGALVAVPSTVLATFAATGDPRTGPTAVRVGALLIVWILGQALVIRSFSIFQPICLALGAWLVVVGRRIGPPRR